MYSSTKLEEVWKIGSNKCLNLSVLWVNLSLKGNYQRKLNITRNITSAQLRWEVVNFMKAKADRKNKKNKMWLKLSLGKRLWKKKKLENMNIKNLQD